MIRLENVTKKIARKVIIDNMSIAIDKPIVYGLLGPNGAGKTTTIRLLCGIIKPTSGKLIIDEKNFNFKKSVGYMPEEIGLYRDMTIEEEIFYFAKLHGLPRNEAVKIAKPLISKFQLDNQVKKKVGTLSKGNVRKVQFICTVLHSPKLIILDEPFSGLDPLSSSVLEREILNLKDEGRTVVLSTHIMEHAEIFCDHVVILNEGKKVIDDNYLSIKENFVEDTYVLNLTNEISSEFKEKYNITDIDSETGRLFKYRITVKSEKELNGLLNEIIINNYTIKSLIKEELSLRKFFLEKTKTV